MCCRGLGEFPTVDDKPTKTLTVVVPAYNEEKRIDKMMTEMIDFLESEEKVQRYVPLRSSSMCIPTR